MPHITKGINHGGSKKLPKHPPLNQIFASVLIPKTSQFTVPRNNTFKPLDQPFFESFLLMRSNLSCKIFFSVFSVARNNKMYLYENLGNLQTMYIEKEKTAHSYPYFI